MNLMFTGNFDTEANYDKVIIYDGMGDSAAMLGSELSGNNDNGIIVSYVEHDLHPMRCIQLAGIALCL